MTEITACSISERIWDSLELATQTRTALTTLVLATVASDLRPKSRVIILRQVDRLQNVVRFATDLRSQKVHEISQRQHVALTGYDGQSNIQIRLEGIAIVNGSEEDRLTFFQSLKPHTHYLFTSDQKPGEIIDYPEAVRFAEEHERTTELAYQNFAIVDVQLDAIEWLDLNQTPHHRLRFEQHSNTWQRHWLVA